MKSYENAATGAQTHRMPQPVDAYGTWVEASKATDVARGSGEKERTAASNIAMRRAQI